jgi:hypothetical protein
MPVPEAEEGWRACRRMAAWAERPAPSADQLKATAFGKARV